MEGFKDGSVGFEDNTIDSNELNPRVANEMKPIVANRLEFPLRGKYNSDLRRKEEDFPHSDMMADPSKPLVRLAMLFDAKELKALAGSVSISTIGNLILFPADKQELRFAFCMWDNDPDDRCRYFRQLHYADNTPWQLGIKREIKSLSFSFLAPEVVIDVFEVSQTSKYILKIHVPREATYYLRTVAFHDTHYCLLQVLESMALETKLALIRLCCLPQLLTSL